MAAPWELERLREMEALNKVEVIRMYRDSTGLNNHVHLSISGPAGLGAECTCGWITQIRA
jgi:hypothetical protein